MAEYDDRPLITRIISEIQPYLQSQTLKELKSQEICYSGLFSLLSKDIPPSTSSIPSSHDLNKCALPNLLALLHHFSKEYSSPFLEIQVTYLASLNDSGTKEEEFNPSKGIVILQREGIRKRLHVKKVEVSRRQRLELLVENENQKENGRTSSQYSFVFTTHSNQG